VEAPKCQWQIELLTQRKLTPGRGLKSGKDYRFTYETRHVPGIKLRSELRSLYSA
jgi:hypothetical protein